MAVELVCPGELFFMYSGTPGITFHEAQLGNYACQGDVPCPPEDEECEGTFVDYIPLQFQEVGEGGSSTVFEALTITEAEQIVSWALLIWVTAWGARKILDMVLERPHNR